MARQAKKENTENMDATVPDQPDVETIASENTAENIVPQSEQNANTEEASAKADDFPSRASGAGANEGSGETSLPGGGAGAESPLEPDTSVNSPAGNARVALESLAVLANRHRVPGWQQAALMRMMGWDDGKMVTDAEYRMALDKLRSRRLGGGRLA